MRTNQVYEREKSNLLLPVNIILRYYTQAHTGTSWFEIILSLYQYFVRVGREEFFLERMTNGDEICEKTILLLLLVRIIIDHQHSRVRCHCALVSLARCVLYLFVVFTEIRSRVVMFFSAGRRAPSTAGARLLPPRCLLKPCQARGVGERDQR